MLDVLEGKEVIVCDNCKRIGVVAHEHSMSLHCRPRGETVTIPGNKSTGPRTVPACRPVIQPNDGRIDLCKECSEGLANAMLALLVKAEG